MSEKNGAEVLVEALAKEQVTKVFGISGHGVTVLLEAMRTQPGLDFISPRHEENAAHMADGWARGTGGVGVCVSTVGPGAVNQAAGLAEAYADSIPVLAITANLQSFLSYPAVGFLEDMDSFGYYRPITKWNAVVHHRGRIAELVQRAFREATTGRPGPVHLDLPLDIMCESAPAEELPGPQTYRPFGRPRGDAGAIERAVALLKGAERPLMVAGGGVIASSAWNEFRSLAATLGIPATTSPMGAGCAPADDSEFFGDGGWLGGDAVIQALNAADVILAVGCRFTSWLGIGRPPVMAGAPHQKVIHVDIDPREIGKNVGVAVGIVGDAQAVLSDMLAAAGAAAGDTQHAAWKQQLQDTYRDYLAGLEPMMGPPEGPITQGRLAKEVGSYLADKNAMVTIDGGSTLLWAFSYLRAHQPRQRFFAGGGHLGSGQPFANALELAHPDRLVVNYCGDGGFGMTLQELDTAVRHRLPVLNIVNNDGGWGMCKAGQFILYGPDACTGIDQDFGTVDYAAIARGFGAYGEQVERVEDILPAIERALGSGLPAVLDVRVQPVPHPMFGVMAAVVLQGCQFPAPAGGPPQM